MTVANTEVIEQFIGRWRPADVAFVRRLTFENCTSESFDVVLVLLLQARPPLSVGWPELSGPFWEAEIAFRDVRDLEFVVIDRERLLELSRTPTYRSRQGERWEFCCQLPCVFTGPLSPNTDLPTLLSSFDLDRLDAERIHAGLADGSIATYSFRCDVCQRQHVGWDRD